MRYRIAVHACANPPTVDAAEAPHRMDWRASEGASWPSSPWQPLAHPSPCPWQPIDSAVDAYGPTWGPRLLPVLTHRLALRTFRGVGSGADLETVELADAIDDLWRRASRYGATPEPLVVQDRDGGLAEEAALLDAVARALPVPDPYDRIGAARVLLVACLCNTSARLIEGPAWLSMHATAATLVLRPSVVGRTMGASVRSTALELAVEACDVVHVPAGWQLWAAERRTTSEALPRVLFGWGATGLTDGPHPPTWQRWRRPLGGALVRASDWIGRPITPERVNAAQHAAPSPRVATASWRLLRRVRKVPADVDEFDAAFHDGRRLMRLQRPVVFEGIMAGSTLARAFASPPQMVHWCESSDACGARKLPFLLTPHDNASLRDAARLAARDFDSPVRPSYRLGHVLRSDRACYDAASRQYSPLLAHLVHSAAMRALPRALRKRSTFQMGLATTRGAGVAFEQHSESWFLQLAGRKRWVFKDPAVFGSEVPNSKTCERGARALVQESLLAQPGGASCRMREDLDVAARGPCETASEEGEMGTPHSRWRNQTASVLTAITRAGDLMWTPRGWWHETCALEDHVVGVGALMDIEEDMLLERSPRPSVEHLHGLRAHCRAQGGYVAADCPGCGRRGRSTPTACEDGRW